MVSLLFTVCFSMCDSHFRSFSLWWICSLVGCWLLFFVVVFFFFHYVEVSSSDEVIAVLSFRSLFVFDSIILPLLRRGRFGMVWIISSNRGNSARWRQSSDIGSIIHSLPLSLSLSVYGTKISIIFFLLVHPHSSHDERRYRSWFFVTITNNFSLNHTWNIYFFSQCFLLCSFYYISKIIEKKPTTTKK